MQTGAVVNWRDKEGWGFVRCESEGRDYFVHFSNIQSEEEHKSLAVGDRVQFDVEPGPTKRIQAVRVEVLQKAVA